MVKIFNNLYISYDKLLPTYFQEIWNIFYGKLFAFKKCLKICKENYPLLRNLYAFLYFEGKTTHI